MEFKIHITKIPGGFIGSCEEVPGACSISAGLHDLMEIRMFAAIAYITWSTMKLSYADTQPQILPEEELVGQQISIPQFYSHLVKHGAKLLQVDTDAQLGLYEHDVFELRGQKHTVPCNESYVSLAFVLFTCMWFEIPPPDFGVSFLLKGTSGMGVATLKV